MNNNKRNLAKIIGIIVSALIIIGICIFFIFTFVTKNNKQEIIEENEPIGIQLSYLYKQDDDKYFFKDISKDNPIELFSDNEDLSFSVYESNNKKIYDYSDSVSHFSFDGSNSELKPFITYSIKLDEGTYFAEEVLKDTNEATFTIYGEIENNIKFKENIKEYKHNDSYTITQIDDKHIEVSNDYKEGDVILGVNEDGDSVAYYLTSVLNGVAEYRDAKAEEIYDEFSVSTTFDLSDATIIMDEGYEEAIEEEIYNSPLYESLFNSVVYAAEKTHSLSFEVKNRGMVSFEVTMSNDSNEDGTPKASFNTKTIIKFQLDQELPEDFNEGELIKTTAKAQEYVEFVIKDDFNIFYDFDLAFKDPNKSWFDSDAYFYSAGNMKINETRDFQINVGASTTYGSSKKFNPFNNEEELSSQEEDVKKRIIDYLKKDSQEKEQFEKELDRKKEELKNDKSKIVGITNKKLKLTIDTKKVAESIIDFVKGAFTPISFDIDISPFVESNISIEMVYDSYTETSEEFGYVYCLSNGLESYHKSNCLKSNSSIYISGIFKEEAGVKLTPELVVVGILHFSADVKLGFSLEVRGIYYHETNHLSKTSYDTGGIRGEVKLVIDLNFKVSFLCIDIAETDDLIKFDDNLVLCEWGDQYVPIGISKDNEEVDDNGFPKILYRYIELESFDVKEDSKNICPLRGLHECDAGNSDEYYSYDFENKGNKVILKILYKGYPLEIEYKKSEFKNIQDELEKQEQELKEIKNPFADDYEPENPFNGYMPNVFYDAYSKFIMELEEQFPVLRFLEYYKYIQYRYKLFMNNKPTWNQYWNDTTCDTTTKYVVIIYGVLHEFRILP